MADVKSYGQSVTRLLVYWGRRNTIKLVQSWGWVQGEYRMEGRERDRGGVGLVEFTISFNLWKRNVYVFWLRITLKMHMPLNNKNITKMRKEKVLHIPTSCSLTFF